MKRILFASALSLLAFNTAFANAERITCNTDTGKAISVGYYYHGSGGSGYTLQIVDVAGEDYVHNAILNVTRGSGVLVNIPSFRDGEGLSLKILGSNSTYKVGTGSERPMNCKNLAGNSPKNDGI